LIFKGEFSVIVWDAKGENILQYYPLYDGSMFNGFSIMNNLDPVLKANMILNFPAIK